MACELVGGEKDDAFTMSSGRAIFGNAICGGDFTDDGRLAAWLRCPRDNGPAGADAVDATRHQPFFVWGARRASSVFSVRVKP